MLCDHANKPVSSTRAEVLFTRLTGVCPHLERGVDVVGIQSIFVGQMNELTQFQLLAANLDILISLCSFIVDKYLISSRLNDCSLNLLC